MVVGSLISLDDPKDGFEKIKAHERQSAERIPGTRVSCGSSLGSPVGGGDAGAQIGADETFAARALETRTLNS